MPRKCHKPEEIVAKLRRVDVLVSQAQSVADAARAIGVTRGMYYRWRQEHGGLKRDQVRRMKALEAENTGLRWAMADRTLDKLILQEAASGNFQALHAAAPASAMRERSWSCPNGRSAVYSDSIARRSAASHEVVTTRSGRQPTASSWRVVTAAMAIGR